MSAPLFVDVDAALAARRENARQAYAWRRENVTDADTRMVHDACERADPVDEELVRWIVGEMARGTRPEILPASLAVIIQSTLSTIGSSSEMPREEAWARFAGTFSWLCRTDTGQAFSSEVQGQQGGRA